MIGHRCLDRLVAESSKRPPTLAIGVRTLSVRSSMTVRQPTPHTQTRSTAPPSVPVMRRLAPAAVLRKQGG